MSRIVKDEKTGCWNWPGAKNPDGYGSIGRNLGGKPLSISTHRLSYEMHKGPIPRGLMVLHKCDNRACCNPDHLFLGDNTDNVRDRDRKGRHARLRGEKHPGAKLTAAQVKILRILFDGGLNRRYISELFKISLANVRAVGERKNWIDRCPPSTPDSRP